MKPVNINEVVDFEESDIEYWLEDYKPVVNYDEGLKQLESDNYFRKFHAAHVDGMTAHGLDSKSSIAAELAYRDYIIVHLLREREIQAGRETPSLVELLDSDHL